MLLHDKTLLLKIIYMEVSELKTGNYIIIRNNNEYFKIEDIIASKNRVVLLSKNGNKIVEKLDNIEPIEVTEEIIKNAGYNTYHHTVIFQSEIDKYNKEGWPLPYNENPYDYYFDTTYGRISFYYGNFGFHPHLSNDSIAFNYMHELQNILNHIHKVNIRRLINNHIEDEHLYKSSIEYWKEYGQKLIDSFDLWKQNK